MSNHLTFSQLERYELKYHIPMTMVDSIAKFLEPWCQLDEYSSRSADRSYWVTSLYLDSPQRTFFHWTQAGKDDRFNMRIRAYSPSPQLWDPHFFEVKHKSSDLVIKTRGSMFHGHPERLWEDPGNVFLESSSAEDLRFLKHFYALSTSWNAAPTLLTQYRRIAWFGVFEEYARVTVDFSLRWREELGFDMTIDPTQMHPTDVPRYFRPGTEAVLELKCPRSDVPWWMMDLIRYLNLERSGFSKFGSATMERLSEPSLRRSTLFHEVNP